jgi:hypothetical protein
VLPDKIGKEQAENDYANKVVPILKVRALDNLSLNLMSSQIRMDLFGAEHPNPRFSLEAYHIMGSRILSRSFQVEAQPRVDGSHTPSLAHEDVEMGFDNSSTLPHGDEDIEGDVESDDADTDDPANVAMVPMADMLNARYGCANVREPLCTPSDLTNPLIHTGQTFLRKPISPNGHNTISSSGRTNRESLPYGSTFLRAHMRKPGPVEHIWRPPQF